MCARRRRTGRDDMPVSLDPPLLSCIQNGSNTWPRLRECGAMGVSVLSREQKEYVQRLPSKEGDRFLGVGMQALPSGAVVLEETHAWFDCVLEAEHPAGDHTIVVLRILTLHVENGAEGPDGLLQQRLPRHPPSRRPT